MDLSMVLRLRDKEGVHWIQLAPREEGQVWSRLHELPHLHLECLHFDDFGEWCCFEGCQIKPPEQSMADWLAEEEWLADQAVDEGEVDEGAPLCEGDPFALERAEDLADGCSFAEAHLVEAPGLLLSDCADCEDETWMDVRLVGLTEPTCSLCREVKFS